MTKIIIMECTLRDGSYAIDYQFTAEDTAIIAAGLEQAGFEFIEIGHGLGLGASFKKYGPAAASDEEYLIAAKNALKKARFGMFCIPGIAELDDLIMAAKYDMGFVRVGANITEVEKTEIFIKKAEELGMLVSCNLMKSYAVSPMEFAKKVRLVADYGADIICVVDSAGGMLPNDVREYVNIVKNETDAKIGFHGHNNLLLAVANSIEAVKSGAEIIDGSLQGMGRSAGNAQTEILLIVLEKLGYSTGIDLYKAMDMGEKVIRPLMAGERGIDSMSATLGYAQFHSSFLNIIYKIAQKYGIDARELVVKVSEVDKVKVTEEMTERISQEIKKAKEVYITQRLDWNIDIDFKDIIRKYTQPEDIAKAVALEMFSLAKKTGKKTVFTIAGTLNLSKKEASFPFIRQNAVYIIGNAEITKIREGVAIAKAIDNYIDFILVDTDSRKAKFKELEKKVRDVISKATVLTYRDTDAQINAVDTLVGQFLEGLDDANIVILGENYMAGSLKVKLSDRGKKINHFQCNAKDKEWIDILIGISPFQPVIDSKILKQVKKHGIIIDAGPGSIFPDAIDEAHKIDIPIYRIDMRAGLSGEIIDVLETYELRNKIMGKKEIAGVDVVAGGILGKRGDIVVDSISNPTKVIGVVDGKGQLLKEDEIGPYIEDIKKVKLEIANRRFI